MILWKFHLLNFRNHKKLIILLFDVDEHVFLALVLIIWRFKCLFSYTSAWRIRCVLFGVYFDWFVLAQWLFGRCTRLPFCKDLLRCPWALILYVVGLGLFWIMLAILTMALSSHVFQNWQFNWYSLIRLKFSILLLIYCQLRF